MSTTNVATAVRYPLLSTLLSSTPNPTTLRDAVRQWADLGAFVAALSQRDHALIARSMEDLIIEPVRKSLVPEFDAIKIASARPVRSAVGSRAPALGLYADENARGRILRSSRNASRL